MSITLFIIVSVIKIALILFVLLTAVAYTVWLERKVVGHMQNRWGPTRVGPFGLLQPAADGVKFLFKEDLTPPHVYKPLYIAAPMIAVVFAVTSIAVIPFGNWLMLAGTFSLRGIVDAQAGHFWGFIPNWFIFRGGQIVAFFIYLTAAYAETNRIPFDLPEAETELVAGYHTEYSAMKFAMFFMAEYANMITVACLASLLFLGGWRGPIFGPDWLQQLLPLFWFVLRVFAFLFVYIWVRGTLPRFRYDQLMAFGWKFLLPLAIANLVVTAVVVALT